MSKNREIGIQGETIATVFLKDKGYEILERNWRFSKAEIDIICSHDDHLIFVEVKTRSYTFYGDPSESVSKHKEELMMDAANAYMAEKNYEWKFRFDIISVVLNAASDHSIDHIEDAFFPGW